MMQQRRMNKKLRSLSCHHFSIRAHSGQDRKALADSHFVREGRGRGLAGRQDHNDEDGDEEES